MSSQRNNRAKISFMIISVFEAILLIAILINRIQYTFIQFDDCSENVIGNVYSTEKSISGNVKFYPVYKIEVEGKEYYHKRLFSSDNITWKIGEPVKMKYNPSNPRQVYTLEEIKSHRSRGLWGIVGTVALACFVFGVKFKR